MDITLPFLLVIIDGSEMEGSNLSFPTTQKSKTPNLKYMGFVYDWPKIPWVSFLLYFDLHLFLSTTNHDYVTVWIISANELYWFKVGHFRFQPKKEKEKEKVGHSRFYYCHMVYDKICV